MNNHLMKSKPAQVLTALPLKQPHKLKHKYINNNRPKQSRTKFRPSRDRNIEDILKQYQSDANELKNLQFYIYNHVQQSNQLRSLENNNFFTAHVLPRSRPPNTDAVTKEYAFVLPSGLCIYQSQPTTKTDPFNGGEEWTAQVRKFEHAGWQVYGMSGEFLVFERLRNSRQTGLKAVKLSAKRYTTFLAILTGAIFTGGWYFGV